jgi:hypothetical protein
VETHGPELVDLVLRRVPHQVAVGEGVAGRVRVGLEKRCEGHKKTKDQNQINIHDLKSEKILTEGTKRKNKFLIFKKFKYF